MSSLRRCLISAADVAHLWLLPTKRLAYEDATNAGYKCSFVNPLAYSRSDRALFIETLMEWGFAGPEGNTAGLAQWRGSG